MIAAMMILALVATLAISAMETTTRDQQAAGIQMRSKVALLAAEAGLSISLSSMVGGATPDLPPATIGVVGDYPMGQPSYQLEPSVPTPIENLGARPAPGMSLNVNGSGPKFQIQLWKLHVQGREPRGMTARVEAAAGSLWGK